MWLSQVRKMARLKEFYTKEIVEKMMKAFGYSSVMQVPKLLKITVNMGVGEAIQDKKHLTAAVDDMTLNTNKKPKITILGFLLFITFSKSWGFV